MVDPTTDTTPEAPACDWCDDTGRVRDLDTGAPTGQPCPCRCVLVDRGTYAALVAERDAMEAKLDRVRAVVGTMLDDVRRLQHAEIHHDSSAWHSSRDADAATRAATRDAVAATLVCVRGLLEAPA